MNSKTDLHLAKLRAIVHAPIDVTESGQFHRYYWMGESQFPHILVNESPHLKKMRSDYNNACHDVRKYWKKVCPKSSSGSSCRASSMFSVILPDETHWKSFGKKDTVGKILQDPEAPFPASLYRSSFLGPSSLPDVRGFHIQSNPISKFGEALFVQKHVIR